MRKLKLIWDFHGPDANKIAEHHEIHLKEFFQKEKIEEYTTGFDDINSMHSIAFIVVNESEMIPIRDALRPHRGEVYEGDL